MSISDRVTQVLQQCFADQPESAGGSFTIPLILAVSGGPDSLTLLHLICEGQLYPRELLIVAHLNHGLRPSADDEATFVMDFAAQQNVRAITNTRDVAGLARSKGLSVEEAGRLARYQFFASVAFESGAHYVATGHNADDQVETIIMHMLRGSAITGLRGMQLCTPLPGAPGLTLIRPLLQINRPEIEAYCVEHNLAPVIDETNQDSTYYRNRLRHELIPLLAEYNPQIRQQLQNMAVILSGDESLLEEMVSRAWEKLLIDEGSNWLALDRTRWLTTPLGLQRRLIRHAIRALAPDLRDVGFRTIEQAREVGSDAEVGSISSLPAGVLLQVGYDKLLFSILDSDLPDPNLPQLVDEGAVDLPIPGVMKLDKGWSIKVQLLEHIDEKEVLNNQDPWQAFISVDNLDHISARTRRPGERFRPLGMAEGSAKVSRVMIDRKIPQKMRARWPIVAGQEHLLWLVGHHIDDRARIDTRRPYILHLQAINQFDEP